jgi:hypothetical protein
VVPLTCPGNYRLSSRFDVLPDYVCCAACGDPIPRVLYQTNAHGTIALTYRATGLYGAGWYGCQSIAGVAGAGLASGCAPATVDIAVLYHLTCGAGGYTLTQRYCIAPGVFNFGFPGTRRLQVSACNPLPDRPPQCTANCFGETFGASASAAASCVPLDLEFTFPTTRTVTVGLLTHTVPVAVPGPHLVEE